MEEAVGIAGYLTHALPVPGRVKAQPEDFVVEEIPEELPFHDDGRFLVVRVTSRNWETNRLVRALARRMGISRRRIGFAGTKDKRAVTTQWMTFADVEAETARLVRLSDVRLEPLGRSRRSLTVGHLLGNRFDLRLRDVPLTRQEASSRMQAVSRELRAAGGFPNFFGPQRFGEVRPVTHLVGRALVQGDVERAVHIYLGHPFPEEPEDARRAREAFEASGDVEQALREFPPRLGYENALLNHLRQRPGDYKGALRQLPRNLLTLFVNAFQAYLFNRMLSLRLARGLGLTDPLPGDLVLPRSRRGLPERGRPVAVTEANREKVHRQVGAGKAWISGLLLGTEAPFAEGSMGDLEREVVEEEGVPREAFAVPSMPRLASRGQRRELLSPLEAFSYRVREDLRLTFRLLPGCYATALLREITKGESP